ncbi:MAG: hypothetical protein AVDCRST_MAG73-1388, partial [uncultured Thermomicrobiales bacterium]
CVGGVARSSSFYPAIPRGIGDRSVADSAPREPSRPRGPAQRTASKETSD